MRFRLLRHATLLIEMAGVRLLVDPLLGAAGSQPPIPDTADQRPNPLVDLPVTPEEAVAGISAAVLTHLHPDHIDMAALEVLPRDRPLLCQPRDAATLGAQGLQAVPVEDALDAGALTITRTGGRHGTGAIGREMGEVSGFVLSAEGEPTTYIAGDTVWCDEVAAALAEHAPSIVVVNAGGARFVEGDPITMDVADVAAVCEAAPGALVVAVHMGAINHCGLTRAALLAAMADRGHAGRVIAPADGEALELSLS